MSPTGETKGTQKKSGDDSNSGHKWGHYRIRGMKEGKNSTKVVV